MDFRKIATFLSIDEDEAEELGRLLVDTMASDLEKLRKGLHDNDLEAVAFVAHSIKGAAGNLGFDTLSQLAAGMEVDARAGQSGGFHDLINELQIHLDALNLSLAGK